MKTFINQLILCLLFVALPVFAKDVTNSDVTSMIKSGLPDKVVVLAIESGTPKFDTSPDGLISLKKAGASDAVIEAVLKASMRSQSVGTTQSLQATTTEGDFLFDGRILLDDKGKKIDLVVENRGPARPGLNFFLDTILFDIRPIKAAIRTSNSIPEFELSLATHLAPLSQAFLGFGQT